MGIELVAAPGIVQIDHDIDLAQDILEEMPGELIDQDPIAESGEGTIEVALIVRREALPGPECWRIGHRQRDHRTTQLRQR